MSIISDEERRRTAVDRLDPTRRFRAPRSSDPSTGPAREDRSPTTEDVWRHLTRSSFAVVGYVTPSGDPRSSGVLFRALGTRLFVVVAPDGWKARHIAISGRVAVTVPVRRGGLLSLVAPIPPATISFHASAIVHPPGSMEIPPELAELVPVERRSTSTILEIVPEGMFVTYGIEVPLLQMRDPQRSRARVPVRT